MPNYYVHTRKDAQGDYEVHQERCSHMPLPQNRKPLGIYASCRDAVQAAKRLGYSPANGCFYCSRECHTS